MHGQYLKRTNVSHINKRKRQTIGRINFKITGCQNLSSEKGNNFDQYGGKSQNLKEETVQKKNGVLRKISINSITQAKFEN